MDYSFHQLLISISAYSGALILEWSKCAHFDTSHLLFNILNQLAKHFTSPTRSDKIRLKKHHFSRGLEGGLFSDIFHPIDIFSI